MSRFGASVSLYGTDMFQSGTVISSSTNHKTYPQQLADIDAASHKPSNNFIS